ncbi:MAG: ATP-dependent DNA helicase RecG [Lachnospiraceae bacterium]|nr:ATP-dependent DNA helicase RecG [Lachnospiraceae bacterium]
MLLTDPITKLKGIGEKTAALFGRVGVFSCYDLITFYPRSYFAYPDPVQEASFLEKSGKSCCVEAVITHPVTGRGGKLPATMTVIQSFGCEIECIWYRSPYIRHQLSPGTRRIFYGPIEKHGNRYRMQQPKVFTPQEYLQKQRRLQPVYSLTKGLKNSSVCKAVDVALTMLDQQPGEYVPERFLKKRGLMSYWGALRHLHFPDDFEDLKEARRRLCYNEFFDFAMEMHEEREGEEELPNPYVFSSFNHKDAVISQLPYELTQGQRDALSDILRDFAGEHVTQRLIQGDVGSGKTILAFLAMVSCAENGYQTVMMAPTEVLARQHYETFLGLIEQYDLPYKAVLLTGTVKGKERKEVLSSIASGEAFFVLGTHALFQEKVIYHKLALAITDEQHRFGVKQRKMLSEKGQTPFSLVMSATPIPRTLAMILYQNMNISVISDVPARRKPIKNALITPSLRRKAYQMILKEVSQGHQAMVICPLVEESDKMEGENVTDYASMLSELFGDKASVGLLYGPMKPEQKDEVMTRFAKGRLDVLVSTTVIEVGVNVPNATVILIEDAQRFGLAQLHQLRGRVGRGDAQSYCMFVDTSGGKEPSKRLCVMTSSNDGFYLANEDLKMRGPGDFYGIRQSGDFAFALADLYQDSDLLKEVGEDVRVFFEEKTDTFEKDLDAIRRHQGLVSQVTYHNL